MGRFVKINFYLPLVTRNANCTATHTAAPAIKIIDIIASQCDGSHSVLDGENVVVVVIIIIINVKVATTAVE